MTEILTESFCERCGTRYTFEPVQDRRGLLGKIGTLGRGFRHFVTDPGSSLDEAFTVARSEKEQRATTHALEAFHRTFNFCLSCHQYACADCWNAVEGRCLSCAPTPEAPDSPAVPGPEVTPGEYQLLPERRWSQATATQRLTPELELPARALSLPASSPPRASSPPATSPSSESPVAGHSTGLHPQSPAPVVVHEEVLDRPVPTRRSAWPTRRRPDWWRWLPPRSRDAVTALAVGWVGIVAVMLIANEVGRAPTGTPKDAQRTSAVGAETDIAKRVAEESFDGLPMNSRLPEPWAVDGAGLAAIVALPTSVDRSARISSSADGARSVACRPIESAAGSPVRIMFDYRLGRLPATAARLLSIRSGDATLLNLVIGPDGGAALVGGDVSAASPESPAGSGAPAAPAAPTEWQRVVVRIDPASSEAEWGAHDSSGVPTSSGTITVADLNASALDRLCLSSPEGSPSGWVAIDDLVVDG